MNGPPTAPEGSASPANLERTLDAWGGRAADSSMSAMPGALERAVRARPARTPRRTAVLVLRAGAGLALAAAVALAVIIWSRAQPPGAPIDPHSASHTSTVAPAPPTTLFALARANRDADIHALVLPEPPPGARPRAGEVIRLGPARLGG